jgi:hypothetical protein
VQADTAFACCDAGLHRQAGGDGSEAGSGELLLESLLACAGVTFNAVATATGATFRPVQLVVEHEGDFRNTLGLDKAVPLGITDIRLRFDEDSDPADEPLSTLRHNAAPRKASLHGRQRHQFDHLRAGAALRVRRWAFVDSLGIHARRLRH